MRYFLSKKGDNMTKKTMHEQLEHRIKELEGKLVEREKELNCLYGLSRIVEKHGLSLDEILQEIPSLLSASWQYPEITCVRILMGDKEFATENFRVSKWRQAADIVVAGKKAGEIGIYYLVERPELDEGPFYKEERNLIDAIAERLGRIIERNQLEEETKGQWEQFAAIIDNFADILYVSDPHTYEVLLVNKSLEKALGRNPVGGLCYREFQGRSSPCDFCTNDIILKDRKPYVWEHYNPLLSKDLLLTDQIIRWPDGREVRYEIAIDITERTRAEEERLRLAAAIQQTQEGVLIADTAAIVQYVNPALEVITGYTRDEFIGRDAGSFLTGEHNGTALNPMQDVVRNGSLWSGHLNRARKDKTSYDAELTITPVRNASGAIMSYVAVERDVTREVKLERELRQSQKMEALGTLAGGIAHDFNNILMPITLNTELALRSIAEPDKTSENLQYVLEAAQRGRELVKQIITFSRRREQKREPVRIVPVIKEALKLLRASLPSTIKMRENIHDDPSEVMLADPTQIHQVLMNLCTNAAHAMREGGGMLEVSLVSVDVDQNAASFHADLKPGPYLRLTVSDTGEGMDRERMERIFEPFFTTKERSEGTGMGLAFVHVIVKNHGGAITVYSEVGKGSTFNMFFPRMKGSFEKERISPMDVPTGKERILLVDDEEPVLRSERTMLESLGYKVIAIAKSDEALKLFRAQPNEFDLVITDQTMPTMTGSKLSRKLLRLRSDIPIILCTGFSEAIDEDKTRAEGIREFVMKPFTTKEMADTIRRVLDA
jgi:PAS domain S-box-containing protein